MGNKSYVSQLSDGTKQKFIKELPKYFGDGNGEAEILSISDKSLVVALYGYNDENERVRLLIYEFFDFYCEVKQTDNRAFVLPNLEPINRFWVRTLKAKFDTYKQDYLAYHNNLINGV